MAEVREVVDAVAAEPSACGKLQPGMATANTEGKGQWKPTLWYGRDGSDVHGKGAK